MVDSKGTHRKLLSIQEAAEFLDVSRATFNKMRAELKIPEVMVGKRPRFVEEELYSVLKRRSSQKSREKKEPVRDRLTLTILSPSVIDSLEVRRNVFDLRLLTQIDPYGAISLLCALTERVKLGEKIELLIDDKHTCQYLKTIQFFYQVESELGERVVWNETILKGASIQDSSILMPITAIKVKGGERIVAENLLKLIRQQGFKDPVGRGIAQILGELADNTMTHSRPILSERVCYISAKRFLLGESNCIIVGVGDPGVGIPETLRQNPKYSKLSDRQALLESFKPHVTSWVNSPRGKGLTDVLSIAMGNRSILRADTGDIGLLMDFRTKSNPKVEFNTPMASVSGTRFGLILIDTNFERQRRQDVEALISAKVSEE